MGHGLHTSLLGAYIVLAGVKGGHALFIFLISYFLWGRETMDTYSLPAET